MRILFLLREDVELRSIPAGSVEREADFLFLGTPDIQIGAGQSATVGPHFVELPAALG